MPDSIGELVRKNESEFRRGSTQISTYVTHSMMDTLDKIEAYLNSRHVSGQFDSLGREKPFFSIVTAAVNIWFRATDIDRKHIRVRATRMKHWINSFIATVHLQAWMRRANFGAFLNEWGRVLARYGSAVVKFVENSDGLHIMVVPWGRLIVDPVDFDGSAKIELIELTPGQLRQRVKTHGYDEKQVNALCSALVSRETAGRQKKDNKSEYIKLYEVHGLLPKSYLTDDESDKDIYVQQMHVVSFVGKRDGRNVKYDDYCLYRGEEEKDPYEITHLIKEDGRTLAIGAVEHLFQAQWQVNHTVKQIRDTLDVTSKLILQTADPQFLGRNILTDAEVGDVYIHGINMPLTQVNTTKLDISSSQNYAVMWKSLGNEIVGISEAMLGGEPKSGTAWRQTEALLQESYSLFELMTENKGLDIEGWMRRRIIPFLKKSMDTTEEVSAVLDQHDIQVIDRMYISAQSIRKANNDTLDHIERMLDDDTVDPMTMDDQAMMIQANERQMQQSFDQLGGQRFFKPSDISSKTWKEQFKDLEWEVEVEITGESRDVQQALTTLNTALQIIVQPGFATNKKAQAIVGRILEMTGTMSPIEFAALPDQASTPAAAGPTELSAIAPVE